MGIICQRPVMGRGRRAGRGVLAYLVRRIGATEGTVENNEAAGQVFTLVGGLQAVLLAFVLISLFDGASDAEDGAYDEADSLVAAVWAADALPAATRSRTRRGRTQRRHRRRSGRTCGTAPRCRRPGLGGAGDSCGPRWPTLPGHRRVGRRTARPRRSTSLWEVYQSRQDRLNTAASGGVNSVVWFALVAGAIMAVSLPILFGGPKPATHILIVSILARDPDAVAVRDPAAAEPVQRRRAGGARRRSSLAWTACDDQVSDRHPRVVTRDGERVSLPVRPASAAPSPAGAAPGDHDHDGAPTTPTVAPSPAARPHNSPASPAGRDTRAGTRATAGATARAATPGHHHAARPDDDRGRGPTPGADHHAPVAHRGRARGGRTPEQPSRDRGETPLGPDDPDPGTGRGCRGSESRSTPLTSGPRQPVCSQSSTTVAVHDCCLLPRGSPVDRVVVLGERAVGHQSQALAA